MRLYQYSKKGRRSIGVAVDDMLVDIRAGWRAANRGSTQTVTIPATLIELLWMGSPGFRVAKEAARYCRKQLRAKKSIAAIAQPLSSVKILAPITEPQKFICIGQNYKDHCKEQGVPAPKSPIIFTKFPTSIIGPGEKVVIPKVAKKNDYEAELAFVIGRKCKNVSKDKAYQYVAGYTIVNDVSARDIQFSDGQWVRGKAIDTYAPMGPCLVTKDEIKNPQKLMIQLKLNGKMVQDSNTKNLIFNIPYLVSFLSKVFTLFPGDIVSTGTPPGVGVFRKPPLLLKQGDTMEVMIEKIGLLRNSVVKAK